MMMDHGEEYEAFKREQQRVTVDDLYERAYGETARAEEAQRRHEGRQRFGGAKTDLPNPKDLIGVKKPPTLSVIPTTALLHMGRAMENGADKYGAFNWRQHPVKASIYVDACMRHLMAWFDGERDAEDSGVHHLGHAMACLGILVDAEEVDGMLDDRPGALQSGDGHVMGPAPGLISYLTRS